MVVFNSRKGGRQVSLRFSNRHQYVKAALAARLEETMQQASGPMNIFRFRDKFSMDKRLP